MRNDLVLTRTILEGVRNRPDLTPEAVQIEGYDPVLVARHVERLHNDKLIEGPRLDEVQSGTAMILVRDLTSAGHEFLNALESKDVWERLTTSLSPTELGLLSIRELASVAKELGLRAVKRKLGLD